MLVILVFILSTLSFAGTATVLFKREQRVQRRIEQLFDRRTIVAEQVVKKGVRKTTPFKNLIQRFAKNIRTTENKQKQIELDLESAGMPIKAEEFITIRIGFFVVSMLLSSLIGIHFFLSIIIGLIGWLVPSYYLKQKKAKRIAELGGQLPQALETMASAMKSGFSFMQAMQLVGKDMPDPIGIEFLRTIKEINLGISMDEAFDNMLNRLPNKDLEIVLTAVLIQRSTGGNLAQILETIQETITERVRMKDELKALTSQGRMSAIVITTLPLVLAFIMNVMNPAYFTPLLTHPLGWALIGGGLLSGILGWIFIQKVVTIEV